MTQASRDPAADWRAITLELSHVDQQHAKLHEALADLKAKAVRGVARGELEKCINFLRDYANFHFLTEERLMLDHAYPGDAYRAHIAEHKAFLRTVKTLFERFGASAEPAAMAETIQAEMANWLTEHITKVDQKLLDFIRQRERALQTGSPTKT